MHDIKTITEKMTEIYFLIVVDMIRCGFKINELFIQRYTIARFDVKKGHYISIIRHKGCDIHFHKPSGSGLISVKPPHTQTYCRGIIPPAGQKNLFYCPIYSIFPCLWQESAIYSNRTEAELKMETVFILAITPVINSHMGEKRGLSAVIPEKPEIGIKKFFNHHRLRSFVGLMAYRP